MYQRLFSFRAFSLYKWQLRKPIRINLMDKVEESMQPASRACRPVIKIIKEFSKSQEEFTYGLK